MPSPRARHDDVLALAAAAVDDGDGPAARRQRGRRGGGFAVAGARAIVAAGLIDDAGAARGLDAPLSTGPGIIGRLRGGDDDHRLAAERVVDQHRPAHESQNEEAEAGGDHAEEAATESERGRFWVLVLSERRIEVICCHG